MTTARSKSFLDGPLKHSHLDRYSPHPWNGHRFNPDIYISRPLTIYADFADGAGAKGKNYVLRGKKGGGGDI